MASSFETEHGRAGADASALAALDIDRLDRLTAIIERTRRSLGRTAAQALWPMLDLPDLPREPPEEAGCRSSASFEFEGHAVRTVTIDGVTWFVGKDVADRLGYTNQTKAMNDHCRGVTKRYPILDSLGRTQEVRVLAEPDVMRLIMKSTLPAAERFERWVFEVVLPQIRRTGRFGGPDDDKRSSDPIPPLRASEARNTQSLARTTRDAPARPRSLGRLSARTNARQLRLLEGLRPFFRECCVEDVKGSVPARPLHQAYLRWAEHMVQRPLSETMFGIVMGRTAFPKENSHGRVVYAGLRLRSPSLFDAGA